MRVMVLVKATPDSEADRFPADWQDAMMAAMGHFNDDLRAAGVLVMAEGLTASAQGKRLRFDGPARTVSEGPFPDPENLVAGFWLWDVKDIEEAVAWALRCPDPMPGRSELEIRPLHAWQ
jgi:hypothetical protein